MTIISLNPVMMFSGRRSSWLTSAAKRALNCRASSAACRARDSSALAISSR